MYPRPQGEIGFFRFAAGEEALLGLEGGAVGFGSVAGVLRPYLDGGRLAVLFVTVVYTVDHFAGDAGVAAAVGGTTAVCVSMAHDFNSFRDEGIQHSRISPG